MNHLRHPVLALQTTFKVRTFDHIFRLCLSAATLVFGTLIALAARMPHSVSEPETIPNSGMLTIVGMSVLWAVLVLFGGFWGRILGSLPYGAIALMIWYSQLVRGADISGVAAGGIFVCIALALLVPPVQHAQRLKAHVSSTTTST